MSVRRSRPVDDRRRLPDLPDEPHAPCVVEDWVTTTDRPPTWWCPATVNGVLVDPRRATDWLEMRARRRWKQARLQWATDRGMTWRQFSGTYAHGAPQWRDRQAFIAARQGASV